MTPRALVDRFPSISAPWGSDSTCQVDLDTTRGSRPYVGLVANIDFAEITGTGTSRDGYTQIVVSNADLASGEDIEDADINISHCAVSFLLNLFKGTLVNQLQSQVSGIIQQQADSALCLTRGDYGCPDGTHSVPDETPTSTCRYGTDASSQCVPILLGTDGRGDLGGNFLGGFSPGTHAYAQILLASGGDGEAVNSGMSLFMYGGFMGTDRTYTTTPAHNSCVPVIDPPPLPTIPRVDSFRGNTIPGTSTETHLGIGIAEDYLNYAGYGMFDSGMLCLGAGTRLSQQLSTGLVSAAVMSLPDLTFPETDSALTIAIRPQQPPVFTLGSGADGDPLIQIALNSMQMDFYVWSTERYVRFMTFQTDLNIGMNLAVDGAQLVPTITGIDASNSSVTNSDLLSGNPDALASVLQTVIGSFAGMLTSSIPPVSLPSVMGFDINVPDGGITRVADSGHNFLGIFANLSLASGAPLTAPVETSLQTSDLTLDEESMQPAHWNEGSGNSVWLHLRAEGPIGVEYEHSYRIDGGAWSAWTPDERVYVDSDVLLLQARHDIEARARVRGEPASVDPTPAHAQVIVDILAPNVQAARTMDGVRVDATDLVSAQEQLEVRFQIDGAWTEWGHDWSRTLAYDGTDVVVEVRDEAGNVGRSQAALIRGLPDPSHTSGCGCSVPGHGGRGIPLGALGLLGVLGAALLRRRRGGRRANFRNRRVIARLAKLAAVLGALGLSLVAMGCSCSSPTTMDAGTACGDSCQAASPGNTTGSICCMATSMCVDYDLSALCDPGSQCSAANVTVDDSCNVTCSMCEAQPALDSGTMATDLDTVLDADGNVHISGYSPGVVNGSRSRPYGDLVFGTWNGTSVDWEIVDGAPSMPVTNDPSGWRGGVSDPGDDVGRWTSIAMQGTTYLISYYDVTNGALKLAAGTPGSWQTHTVDDAGDSGRYSSLVVTPDGVPMIAYLRIQESTDTPGQVMGSVMVATANIANPASTADWTLTQVASGAMNCRAAFCESAPTCLATGQCVSATTDCSSACSSGQACFNGSCVDTIGDSYVEDMPPAYGLYTSLAIDPMGGAALVYYDRTAGNIYGVRFDGSSWGDPFLIDGYGMSDPFVGDCGEAADVTVDSAGLWHVAYVDGTEETLRYAQVQSDGTVTPEVVDDGSTDGTNPNMDGRHIVGDDASIVVLEGGGVRVAYQDSTVQHAVVAVRPAGGGDWAISHVDSEGSTGYWVDQQLLGTTSYLTCWWRKRDGRQMTNGIHVVTAE